MIEIDQQTAVAAVVVCAIVFAFLTYLIGGVFAYRVGREAGYDDGYETGYEDGCTEESYAAPYRTEHLETALRNLIDAVLDIHGHSEDMEAAIDAAEDLLSKTD